MKISQRSLIYRKKITRFLTRWHIKVVSISHLLPLSVVVMTFTLRNKPNIIVNEFLGENISLLGGSWVSDVCFKIGLLVTPTPNTLGLDSSSLHQEVKLAHEKDTPSLSYDILMNYGLHIRTIPFENSINAKYFGKLALRYRNMRTVILYLFLQIPR